MKKLLLAGLLLVGCAAPKSQVMTYQGKVILIRGCEVCISYDIVNMDWENKSLGCFAHLMGHRYQIGDTYPDPEKHSTGQYVDCEQGADWNDRIKSELISDADNWRKESRKRFRRQKRMLRKNGIGLFVEPQSGELV